MNIAVIDADIIGKNKHRFPNLATMKISSYYKLNGDTVVLETDYNNVDNYDKVFISKVFTDTPCPDYILKKENVEFGGTGFFYDKAKPLDDRIEHIIPDYDIYNDWISSKIEEGTKIDEFKYYKDYSIGFMTRGCIRQCSFCVNKNYKSCNLHSPIEEFLDNNRKKICLLDDNVFACTQWRLVFESLKNTGKRFQFKQGLDERLLTDEKCKILFSSKWDGDYMFAFDNIKERDIIEDKLSLIKKYAKPKAKIKFYTFCAYNHEKYGIYNKEFWHNDIRDLFERIVILMKYQYSPYIMRYKDYDISPYRGSYINIASWCNQNNFYKKMSYREWVIASDNRVASESSTMKYMKQIEEDFPDIAEKYFDIKYEDFKN